MRFLIKQAGCGSERVGYMTGFVKAKNAIIETPTAALLTQGGSVAHLTAEVLCKVFSSTQLLWVPLSNSAHLATGLKAQGEGVAKFAGLQNHVTCVAQHNLNDITPLGHFEADAVPLWTKHGKQMITAEKYMDMMEQFKPDIILALADGRTSLSDGLKRNIKAVNRTCNMLDVCVERHKVLKTTHDSSLIGVITGTATNSKCDYCIKHILTHKEFLAGVALAGITDGTEDSMKISIEKLEDIFKRISESLPADLVKFVEGCWTPDVIVTAIQHGWDAFDGSYPAKITNAGHALVLNFDINGISDELCLLDLNDACYKEDFRPILEGCECLACRKHTRAYIHHLLNTREMLSSVLLSIHNLHHFDQMFIHARHHISSKTFNTFKLHIIKQYQIYQQKAASKIEKESTETAKEETEHMKKKICVSNGHGEGVVD